MPENYCEGCEQDRPLVTPHPGYCVECATIACADGNGDAVELPTVDDVPAALGKLAAHRASCTAPPDTCPVCAFATVTCPECGEDVDHNNHDGAHVTMAGIVAIGCEGYHLPVLRAAAARG